MVGNFSTVLNFNRFYLKLNRFICNQLPVLPDHWPPQTKLRRRAETDLQRSQSNRGWDVHPLLRNPGDEAGLRRISVPPISDRGDFWA